MKKNSNRTRTSRTWSLCSYLTNFTQKSFIALPSRVTFAPRVEVLFAGVLLAIERGDERFEFIRGPVHARSAHTLGNLKLLEKEVLKEGFRLWALRIRSAGRYCSPSQTFFFKWRGEEVHVAPRSTPSMKSISVFFTSYLTCSRMLIVPSAPERCSLLRKRRCTRLLYKPGGIRGEWAGHPNRPAPGKAAVRQMPCVGGNRFVKRVTLCCLYLPEEEETGLGWRRLLRRLASPAGDTWRSTLGPQHPRGTLSWPQDLDASFSKNKSFAIFFGNTRRLYILTGDWAAWQTESWRAF